MPTLWAQMTTVQWIALAPAIVAMLVLFEAARRLLKLIVGRILGWREQAVKKALEDYKHERKLRVAARKADKEAKDREKWHDKLNTLAEANAKNELAIATYFDKQTAEFNKRFDTVESGISKQSERIDALEKSVVKNGHKSGGGI